MYKCYYKRQYAFKRLDSFFKNIQERHEYPWFKLPYVCIQLKLSQDIMSALYVERTALYIIIYIG